MKAKVAKLQVYLLVKHVIF